VRTQLFLFAVAALGGALNAVAGGGSFFTLPALLYAGVGAVAANATSTLAMWPASLASAVAYRREIGPVWQWLLHLGAASLVGGLVGGLLLVKTSDTHFLALLPWLLLAAVATFTFGGPLTAALRRRRAPAATPFVPRGEAAPAAVVRPPRWMLLLQLVIATYGGYFGGGMGIMMLAALSVAGLTNIHEMNGLKTLLAVAINGVALIAFVADGAIAWGPGVVMVAGGIVGGYAGARLARRGGSAVVRGFVMVVGWVTTVYFFLR
jgi:uncharacterized membrane protein YfcA